jgi:putative membrane protein
MSEEEEDPRPRLAYDRTLLANERTFAAWLRTGLSVAGVGIAAAHLMPGGDGPRPAVLTAGALLVFAGIAIIAFGAWRFAAVARDLAGSGSRSTEVSSRIVYALAALVSVLLVVLLVFL